MTCVTQYAEPTLASTLLYLMCTKRYLQMFADSLLQKRLLTFIKLWHDNWHYRIEPYLNTKENQFGICLGRFVWRRCQHNIVEKMTFGLELSSKLSDLKSSSLLWLNVRNKLNQIHFNHLRNKISLWLRRGIIRTDLNLI